jgi:2-keto-4-pentenoate hydratase/2-oxohepta-3-ene-1,7-dioic acid hydratase in catechol pathway
MRIASWSWGGRHHAGTISACGREATPPAVGDASRIVNDVSARDVQVRHPPRDLGKSFDTFCPMGKDLVFDIATLVETCSRGITLHPGDVIATGSPAGVGMGFAPPSYLDPGDVVPIEIDGIGAIENRFQ